MSSHNRLPLLRRTLWSLATRPPAVPFEVVLADDGSTDDIAAELRKYSSVFPWKFVRVDEKVFEAQTGLKKFLNNPAWTNNVAFRHSDPDSRWIFQQGNEVMAWESVYDRLLAEAPASDYFLVMSTTFDVPSPVLAELDLYGTNLNATLVKRCEPWPLQSSGYHSDVTNYLSLASRATWEALGGYDERYVGGISAEDSDFVRRARLLSGFALVRSEALSLHQFHAGKTRYYDPPPRKITKQRWAEGAARNHAIFENWDGLPTNPQQWPWGEIGVMDVITH